MKVYTQLVDENIQARIRFADVLSGIAAKHGMLFTNNGNKTEIALATPHYMGTSAEQ